MNNNVIAPIPDALLTFITRKKTVSNASAGFGGVISEGHRNDTLFRLGAAKRGKGASDEDVREFLLEHNREYCQPPLEEAEVLRIIHSVSQFPVGDGTPTRRPQLAELVLASNRIITDVNENSYRYNRRYWEPISFRQLERLIFAVDDPQWHSKTRCHEGAYFIQHKSFRSNIQWNLLEIGEVPFQNGVYSLATGQIRTHRPEDMLERVLPYEYHAEALCPTWDRYLETCFDGDPEAEQKIAALEQFMGYLLMTTALYKKALLVYGKPDTGKTVLQHVMASLLGDEAVCSIPLEDLSQANKLTLIKGKGLNIISEISTMTRWDHPGFKRAVSTGEPIQLNPKYKDQEMYTPHCKHVIFTNELPLIPDTSGATFNRLLVVKFPNVIPVEERDPSLQERLKDEIPGIALRALRGLKRLLENKGQFTTPPSSTTFLEQYKADSNPLQEFMDTCFIPYPGDMIPMIVVRRAFRLFYPSVEYSDTKLTHLLRSMGYEIRKTSFRNSKGTYLVGYTFSDETAQLVGYFPTHHPSTDN